MYQNKESEGGYMIERYRKALEEVLSNLRSIEAPNPGDNYIDDSIKIIYGLLEEITNENNSIN